MSRKGVAIVIGMAAVDQDYRTRLQNDPHDAMQGYELTGAEMQAIAGMDHGHLDNLARALNHRMKEWLVDWAIG